MVTNIELSDQELADLKELTNQQDAAEAIRAAMLDYLRYARRMQLKELSGRVQLTDNWQKLEQAELDEHGTAD
ncbi:MAG: hypothetical protein MI757_12260 [Pirellulales bacterium]|nr:hypothetical protein [Pirellulales bacterium]